MEPKKRPKRRRVERPAEIQIVNKIHEIYVIQKETADAVCTLCDETADPIKMTKGTTKGLHVHANAIHNVWQRGSIKLSPIEGDI